MNNSIKEIVTQEIKAFFRLKQTERLWHIPVLASLCVGIPLFVGLYFDNLRAGLVASMAGLVILYLPTSSSIANRMTYLLISSFMFMISYAIGLIFSFQPIVSAIVLGLFSAGVHWVTLYFKTRPPGSFFFIMIASTASCIPFQLHTIPERIGLMGMGTMFVCLLALIYCFMTTQPQPEKNMNSVSTEIRKKKYVNIIEALIIGLFMFGSLLIGRLLKLQNPYWVPVSCAAVMQGASLYHIWQRVFHRVLGTFLGFALCWTMLSINKAPLGICISIMILQFIVEMLVVRHYALAVIFITPLTVLLTEAANPLIQNPNMLVYVRFWDILLGSGLGLAGGWILYHEKIRHHAVRRIRKTRKLFKRI
jgi:Predicted membrane protein